MSRRVTYREREESLSDEKIPIYDCRFKKAESAVCRLVRTACQSFAYGGDPKCHERFMVYISVHLHAHGLDALPLTPYRGINSVARLHNRDIPRRYAEEAKNDVKSARSSSTTRTTPSRPKMASVLGDKRVQLQLIEPLHTDPTVRKRLTFSDKAGRLGNTQKVTPAGYPHQESSASG